MTDYYLRSSDGDDGSDGLSWANAFATFSFAHTQMSAGDRCFVSSSHSESTAMTNKGGGADDFLYFISVDDTSGEPPTTLQAGASITLTASGDMNGMWYFYGITLIVSSNNRYFHTGTGIGTLDAIIWDNCTIRKTGGFINFAEQWQGYNKFENSTIDVEGGAVPYLSSTGSHFIMLGGGLEDNGTVTYPFELRSNGRKYFYGCDMSTINDNKMLNEGTNGYFYLCKFGASQDYLSDDWASSSYPGDAGINVLGEAYACSFSGDGGVYSASKISRTGRWADETTVVRTEGAKQGSTNYSMKFDPTGYYNGAHVSGLPIEIVGYAKNTSETTFVIEIMHDSLVPLTNEYVWMDLYYPAADGTMNYATSQQTPKGHGDGTNLSAGVGNGNWTTTGLTNPYSQRIEVTVTPGSTGIVYAQVFCQIDEKIIYVDPIIRAT